MELIESVRPLLAVSVSLLAVPVIISSRRSPNTREGWTFAAAFLKFGIVLSMLPGVLGGIQYTCILAEVIPGVPLALRVDPMGMLFALVSSSLWILTSLYSIGYMRTENEHGQTRYFAHFALALSATIGVAFSANLLTLYLFYEMLSLSTWPLVTHHQDEEARSSGRKYLLYIMGTSIGLVLPAMIISYLLAGTLEFSPGGFLGGTAGKEVLTVLLLMFLFGFAKAGIMPFHSWLPAAMVAPTPVSSLLHAVAVVKVGVFSIIRVVTGVFGVGLLTELHLGTMICAIAGFTMITASLIALSQDNLKRMLAFSTIAQLSYIVLGMGLLSSDGLTGGLLHIAMHAFGKITLFFCAGAIFVSTGKKYISGMTGIGHRMPITMGAFFIGALSIIGMPPCGGFLSKWHLVLGSLEAGQMPIIVLLLVSSFLNCCYFMPVVYNAFFCQPRDGLFEEEIREAPPACLIPLCVTAACSVCLLFFPGPFLELARLAVQLIISG